MKIVLIPFSFIFRIIVYFRNTLYNIGIFKTKILEPKIISIGNLSAGGTGKTPFVELVSRYLLEKGKFIVIVSKGYKRDYDDIKVVEVGFENSEHKLNTENFGDESLMLLENLSDCKNGRGLLVVGDDKTKTAKFAATKFKPEILIIDDGFQHRKLFRDLDIVILNCDSGKWLLPAGRLREPEKNYRRADLLVINNKFESVELIENKKNKPKVVCSYQFEGLLNYKSETRTINEIKNAVVFCGIGAPRSFLQLPGMQNINIVEYLEFPDHHNFSIKDLEKIISAYEKSAKADIILTTQKDFVRLKNSELVINAKAENLYKKLLYNYPLFYAKIKMQINQNADILFTEIDNLLTSE